MFQFTVMVVLYISAVLRFGISLNSRFVFYIVWLNVVIRFRHVMANTRKSPELIIR